MSNKSFRLLWFKLRLNDKKQFMLNFPVPLYVLQELFDCTLDLLSIACMFSHKNSGRDASSQLTVYNLRDIIMMAISLFDSLSEDAPYDLADISTEKAGILISIK